MIVVWWLEVQQPMYSICVSKGRNKLAKLFVLALFILVFIVVFSSYMLRGATSTYFQTKSQREGKRVRIYVDGCRKYTFVCLLGITFPGHFPFPNIPSIYTSKMLCYAMYAVPFPKSEPPNTIKSMSHSLLTNHIPPRNTTPPLLNQRSLPIAILPKITSKPRPRPLTPQKLRTWT